jgi:branched-chain amino acid transport system permease protein
MSDAQGRRTGLRLAAWAIGLVVFIAIPLFVRNPYLLHLAVLGMIFSVVASSWDLTLGYAGVFNFAHIALFGIGAYTSGILSVRLGVSPWLGIPAGTIAAVIVAAIVSIPAIRLRGIYVALLTFAFAQLTSALIVSQTAVTGGLAGLTGVPPLKLGDIDFQQNVTASFYLAGVLLLASTVFLRRVVTSDFGLSLIALRDFEEYAVSRGVPLARQRFLAFLLSAVFTGAAGAFYVHYLRVASPEVLGFSLNTLFLSMILIGGAATIYGSIIAGILLTFVSELMAPLGPVRFMVVSVLIVLTMWFMPQGIWGMVQRALDRQGNAPGTPFSGDQTPPPVSGVPQATIPD